MSDLKLVKLERFVDFEGKYAFKWHYEVPKVEAEVVVEPVPVLTLRKKR
jgi:hypothetical protein